MASERATPTSATIDDLAPGRDPTAWRPLDDDVMGGVSASSLIAEDGVGVFSGTVSTANGGGFASVRRPVSAGALAGLEGLRLLVRGDGRRYRVTFATDGCGSGESFQHEFTAPSTWTEIEIDFRKLAHRTRGTLHSRQAKLDPGEITRLGLLVGKDAPGRFRLEVGTLHALDTAPRDLTMTPRRWLVSLVLLALIVWGFVESWSIVLGIGRAG